MTSVTTFMQAYLVQSYLAQERQWLKKIVLVVIALFFLLASLFFSTAQAVPVFQAAGPIVPNPASTTANTTTGSPAWPAHAVGDVALLFVESKQSDAVTLTVPAGFVEVANSPQSGGTRTKLNVFWARATSTTMPTPTISSTDHVYAQILTYRGVFDTGNPWDVTGGGGNSGQSTGINVSSITTTIADTLVVQVGTRDTDSTAASFSAQLSPTMGDLSTRERSDGGTTSGNGGGFAIWDGIKTVAGATGVTTATTSNARTAWLSIALKPQAPPTVAKSFSPDIIPVNGTSTLSITLTNPNAVSVLSGVAFTDTYPSTNLVNAATPNVTNTCGGTVTAAAGGSSLALSGGTIPGGGSCTVTVVVTSAVPAAYNNTTGPVTTAVTAAGTAAAATLNVYTPPTVTKTFTPATIGLGSTSSMVITVTNPTANPGNITGAAINDAYTGTLTNNAAGSVVCSGAGSATLSGGVNGGTAVGFTAGTIVPGGTCTITQSVTATSTNNNTTSAPTATGPLALTGTAAAATLTVSPASVAKTFGAASINDGATTTLVFTLTNGTGNPAQAGIAIGDTLPSGLRFNSATPAVTYSAGCSGPANAAYASGTSVLSGLTGIAMTSGTASCTVTLAGLTNNAGQTGTCPIAAQTNLATSVTTTNISNASTNQCLTVTSIILTVTKATTTPTVVNTATGTTATYTVTVTNSGTANATGVKLSDTLAAGFTYASTSSVTVNGTAVASTGYTVAGTAAVPTWDTNPAGGFTIDAGQTLVVTFVANVANTVADGVYNNLAAVTSTNATSTTNFDGTATTEDVLVKSAVLAVTKTTSTPVVTNTILGTTATYTVTVTNSGTAVATGVKLTDVLPAGFSYASTTSVTENGNPITTFTVTGTSSPQWDTSPTGGFTIDPGKTLQIVFVANVASTVIDGTYHNSATASSNNAKTIANFDGTLAANTADNVTVNSAVLTATKTTSTPTVVNAPTDATAAYAITVTNSGGGSAPNVTVRDLLPAGFIYKGTVSVVLNGTTLVATTDYTIDTSTANPLWAGTGVDGFVINGGQSLVITLEATVPTTVAAGVYHNGVDIEGTAATVADYIATSNTTDDVTVTGPILTVTKTTSTPTVTNTASGTTASYTVTVVNSGTADATGVKVIDTLAAGFIYGSTTSITLNGTAVAPANFQVITSGTQTSATPQWDTNPTGGFTINPSKSLQLVFTATVASTVPDATYNNSASVTSTNATNITNFDGSASAGENVTVTSAVLAVTKTTSTPTVTNTATGTTATYTITVANTGTANATGVKVSDTLATGFTYASTSSVTVNGAATTAYTATGVDTNVANWDTNPTGGFTVNAGQSLVITFVAKISSAVATGTYSNSASATSTNAKAITNFDGANNTTDDVTVNTPTGVSLYGTAYNDANHNLQLDGGESGTGLTLYAKLIPSAGGSALQAVPVNISTGAYTLVTVTTGNYSIILDDNNVLADTTPTVPSGWIGTEMPNFTRTNVVVNTVDLNNLNFGLFNGSKLSGTVFADIGTTGGTANNGVKDGAELGIAGATVKASTGAITHDSAITDGAGNYTLWIAAAAANPVLITETNLSNYLSTGGSIGNTAGTYTRATDATSFTITTGTIYTNVNFGDVPVNTFAANGQQTGLPGNVLFYAHQFNAGSAGTVVFSSTSTPDWPSILYRDINCNGLIDATDTVLSTATVIAGEQICVIDKVTIPTGTAIGLQANTTVQVVFTYTNASPALSNTLSVIDTTIVGAVSAGLVLTKAVDKTTAQAGETVTYTLTYTNNSSAPLASIVINDATPAYTTFLSARCVVPPPLPLAITDCVVTAPTVGATGSVKWTLIGTLSPSATAQVEYKVKVDN